MISEEGREFCFHSSLSLDQLNKIIIESKLLAVFDEGYIQPTNSLIRRVMYEILKKFTGCFMNAVFQYFNDFGAVNILLVIISF